jgi:predicted dehydrogenase
MNEVRFGILGAGAIVRDFHLPALLCSPRAKVIALGNLHSKSLRSVGALFGIDRLYTDLEQMAGDPEVDAVLVALPNYLHASATRAMLRHGKHVLCEKPMACKAADAQSMVMAAEAAHRCLVMAYPWRSEREVNWLRRVVQSGLLGRVIRVHAHCVVAGGGPAANSWSRNPDFSGGGALLDVGIHGLNTISFLFGDSLCPRQLFACTSTNFGPGAVEDTATMMIEFRGGMTAVLDSGWDYCVSLYPHGTIEVYGESGYARIFPPRLICRHHPDAGDLQPPAPRTGSHIERAMYEAQINHFIECILDGQTARCDGWQGLWDLRLIEAAYESAVTSRSVNMEERA